MMESLQSLAQDIGKELIVINVVSILGFIAYKIFPYIQQMTADVPRLDVGKWEAKTRYVGSDKEVAVFYCKIELTQIAYDLTGTYEVKNTYENGRPDSTSDYKIRGKISSNGFVTLNAFIKEKHQTGMVNFLLQVDGGGDKLVGVASWIDRDKNSIAYFEGYTLNRKHN